MHNENRDNIVATVTTVVASAKKIADLIKGLGAGQKAKNERDRVKNSTITLPQGATLGDLQGALVRNSADGWIGVISGGQILHVVDTNQLQQLIGTKSTEDGIKNGQILNLTSQDFNNLRVSGISPSALTYVEPTSKSEQLKPPGASTPSTPTTLGKEQVLESKTAMAGGGDSLIIVAVAVLLFLSMSKKG